MEAKAKASSPPLTIRGQKLSGEELEPVIISGSSTVQQLSDLFRQQLVGAPCRVTLALHGQALSMDDTVESCRLTDGADVHVIIRPDAWTLREVDMDTGLRVVLEGDACWEGETLLLRHETACASPGWDICPDLDSDFAVEATVKLDEWPGPDWQGTVVSQHGSGTGWELRCGGPGVNCVFTTSRGGHNEHMLPLKGKVGKWHHLCMVYEKSTRSITLYADGVGGEPKKIEGKFKPHTRGGVEIGRNPAWHDRGIVGRIRNATVWPQGLNTKDLPFLAAEQVAQAEASELDLKPTSAAASSG